MVSQELANTLREARPDTGQPPKSTSTMGEAIKTASRSTNRPATKIDEHDWGSNHNCKPKHKPASHPNRRTRLGKQSQLPAEAETGQPPTWTKTIGEPIKTASRSTNRPATQIDEPDWRINQNCKPKHKPASHLAQSPQTCTVGNKERALMRMQCMSGPYRQV